MTASDLLAMGESKFVSLTTFRKTGVPVSTAVWIARDGDELVVTTPGGSGKVKRLRHTSRIELRPCSRMGKVEPDAPVAVGSARLEDTDAARERANGVLGAKYGLEFKAILGVERIASRGEARVIVRIGDAA